MTPDEARDAAHAVPFLFEPDDQRLERLTYIPGDAVVDLEELRRSADLFDADVCAVLLLNLRDLAAQVSDTTKAVQARMVDLLGPKGEYDLAGVGTLKVRRATDRKEWDHALVAYRVAADAVAHRAPDEDGSIDRPEDVAVAAVLDAAGIGYWRTGELRKRGIDPDTYCTRVDRGYTVELPPRPTVELPEGDER